MQYIYDEHSYQFGFSDNNITDQINLFHIVYFTN